MASAAAANAVLEDFAGNRDLDDLKLTASTTTVLVNRVEIEVTCKVDPDDVIKEDTDTKWTVEGSSSMRPIDFRWRNDRESGRAQATSPTEDHLNNIRRTTSSTDELAARIDYGRSTITDSRSDVTATTTNLQVRKRNGTEESDSDDENPADLSMTSSLSSSSSLAVDSYHSRNESFHHGRSDVTSDVISSKDCAFDNPMNEPGDAGGHQHVKIVSTGLRIVPDAFRRFHPPNKRRKLRIGVNDNELRVNTEDEDSTNRGVLEERWNVVDDELISTRRHLLTDHVTEHVTSSSSHHNKSTCFSIANILRPEFGSALSAKSSSPSSSPSMSSPLSIAEDLTSPRNRPSSSTPLSEVAASATTMQTPTSGHKIELVDRKRPHQRQHLQGQPRHDRQRPALPPSNAIVDHKSGNHRPDDYIRCYQPEERPLQQHQRIEYQLQQQMQQCQQQAAIRRHQHSNLVAASTAAALLQQHHVQHGHPVVNPYAAFYAAAIAAAAAAAQAAGNASAETGSDATSRDQIARGPFIRVPIPLGAGRVLPQPISAGKPAPIIGPNGLTANIHIHSGKDLPCRLADTLADRFSAANVRMIANNNNNNKDDDAVDIKAKFDCCNGIRFDSEHQDNCERVILNKPRNLSASARRALNTSPRQLAPNSSCTPTASLDSSSYLPAHRQPHQQSSSKSSQLQRRHSLASTGPGNDTRHQQQARCTPGGSETNQSSTRSTTSSVDLSHSEETGFQHGSTKDKTGVAALPWPAWVYCTRYSDRPSSGPRSRKPKKKDASISQSDEKRPRTAFTASQLERLKHEFDASKYLSEERRQALANELSLNESQIKIWFQNKRAKMKKASGVRNQLALQLMAQGLYNHSSSSSSSTSTAGGVMMPGPAAGPGAVTVGSSHV